MESANLSMPVVLNANLLTVTLVSSATDLVYTARVPAVREVTMARARRANRRGFFFMVLYFTFFLFFGLLPGRFRGSISENRMDELHSAHTSLSFS